MPSYERIYLDTSVYLALIKGEEGRVDTARDILEDARRGALTVVASTFVAAEIIRSKGSGSPLRRADEAKIDRYLFHQFITWVELDLLLAMDARRLAGNVGLQPADAVHLASAVRGECEYLFRWDDRFKQGTYEGVVVRDPFWDGQPCLPEVPSE